MGCTQKATVDDMKLAVREEASDTLKEIGIESLPKGVQLANPDSAWRRCYTLR